MIGTVCVMIRRPKGEEVSTHGIRTAWAMCSSGLEAHVLLVDDGVFNGLDNPGYNTELMKDFLKEGGRVYCHGKAAEERGLAQEQLLEGIEIIEDDRIAEIIRETEGTLTF